MNNSRYTDLDKIKQNGDYDFYGIIYDATYPTKENDSDNANYICAIKVLGPGSNWITNPDTFQQETIYIIIKSNSIDYLPHIRSIGNIIRIHRGIFRPKNRKNIYLNLTNISMLKSSWVVFSLYDNNKSYRCISSSSTNYSFEVEDKNNLDYLRSWAIKYFSTDKSLQYSKTLPINKRCLSAYESDLIAIVAEKQIENINDIDDFAIKHQEAEIANNSLEIENKENLKDNEVIILYIMDEHGCCQLHVDKKFNYIMPGDMVRIRSFKSTMNKNIIKLNNYSNILVYPKESSAYFKLLCDLSQNTSYNNLIVKSEPSIITKKDTPNVECIRYPINENNVPFISNEQDLLKYIDNNKLNNNPVYFKSNLYIYNITPSNPNDIVYLYKKEENNSYLVKESISTNTNNNSDYYYSFNLLASFSTNSNKLFSIIYNNYDNEGNGFLGIDAGNCYMKPDLYNKILKSINNLQFINSNYLDYTSKYISVCIQVTNNKLLRIVGDYNNFSESI